MDGQLSAVLKQDHEAARAQAYSELVANRLAMFLGIPVIVGVPAWAKGKNERLHFAALRAAEEGLSFYDFTDDDRTDLDDEPDDVPRLPDGLFQLAGHVRPMTELCQKYPLETAFIAVFDLWIGNEDLALNFKAELAEQSVERPSRLIRAPRCYRAATPSEPRCMNSSTTPIIFQPFQNLEHPRYGGAMVERISSMPDWAILSAATYDDTVGNVTLDEQFAAYGILLSRKKMLGSLVDRMLF